MRPIRNPMTANYLIIGENAKVRDSLAVLLRSRGYAVTVAPGVADAIQVLRGPAVDAVLIVGSKNDVEADRLRTRILLEQPGARVLLLHPVLSGGGGEPMLRFGLGGYRLTEHELLGLLDARVTAGTDEHEAKPVCAGVEAMISVVDVLVGLRELSDNFHRGSAHRSTYLARAVAERMKLSAEEILELVLATLLRDIGTVDVGDLTQQPAQFTTEQRVRMQDHVLAGVRLLEHIEFPWAVLPIIRHHHERYDGTGYPDGLSGPEIPLGARIVAVVDAYIAMLADRPHRASSSTNEAQAELVRNAGRQFDPEVVEVLLSVIREGAVTLSTGERPRVLIADPELEFVKLLKFRLVNEGMDVDTVSSVEEAILEILEQLPTLVLAGVGSDRDLTLHLLREVREDSALRLIPVILLQESEDRAFKVQAFRQGADDCMVKSVGLEEIVARIGGILSREAMRCSEGEHGAQRGITGQLENLSLPDIFQTLNLGLKTARVKLQADRQEGTIWFESGSAVHAEAGEQLGVPACYEMLCWTSGEFCIEHGLETDQATIDMDTMFMVMEGLRQRDEATQVETENA